MSKIKLPIQFRKVLTHEASETKVYKDLIKSEFFESDVFVNIALEVLQNNYIATEDVNDIVVNEINNYVKKIKHDFINVFDNILTKIEIDSSLLDKSEQKKSNDKVLLDVDESNKEF